MTENVYNLMKNNPQIQEFQQIPNRMNTRNQNLEETSGFKRKDKIS